MTRWAKPMARGLIFFFCSVFCALDVFGTSFAKNDLYYIENDAEELPPDKMPGADLELY